MKDIVIVGYGGMAKEVAFLIEEINRHEPRWKMRGYISATRDEIAIRRGKYTVIECDDWLARTQENLAVTVAIGAPHILATAHTRLKANRNLEFPNLIHPAALGDWAECLMGEGNIVMGGVSFTTTITIGALNVVQPGATIAHDCILGSYNLVNPGANISGGVVVGDQVLVGTGAQILQSLSVCSRAVIGAGAVVTRNIELPGVYVGVPARKVTSDAP